MKKLIIFMIMLSFLMFSGGIVTSYADDEVPTTEETVKMIAQKAELIRVKNFVKDLREKLPTETLIITKDNFKATTGVIEYLLQKQGWKESDYFISGRVVGDPNGAYAIYNIYIRLYAFGATFFTEATFEWQDIEKI